MERLYTVQQAADYLHCSRSAIYKWMDANKMRYVKIGFRGRRIPESALQDFLRDPVPIRRAEDQGNTKPTLQAA